MKDIEKLIQSLHPLERKVLPILEDSIDSSSIVKKSDLQEIEVLRALQWLQNKDIILVKRNEREVIKIDTNGKKYLKKGLPERRFLNVLREGSFSLEDIKDKGDLDQNETSISLGILKRSNSITLGKQIKLTNNGKKLLNKEFAEELLLKKLPIDIKKLSEQEKSAFEFLLKRKEILKTEIEKTRLVTLTQLGLKLKDVKIKDDLVETLTHEMLLRGGWKGKNFRRYDLKSEVPRVNYGRKHFVNDAISYIKRIWLDLGFKEMTGSFVQTGFWNFDSLFTPQDHPAREMHDTFYIKDPIKGKLSNKKIVNNVKQAHEKGINGSKGWGYSWKEEESKRNVLRTHTTCLSAKTIASLKSKDLPAKFFSVGKVFRNETVDWKHSFEFEQTEGIVIDEDVNFRHLLGYLKEFFNKMGFDKIRFRPAFFPYVSCSCEIEVYHPLKKQWIELGGSGILRPEVVVPLLGRDVPVLAWGLGLGRIIMDYYKIHDLRDLYGNDLKKIREIKSWMR